MISTQDGDVNLDLDWYSKSNLSTNEIEGGRIAALFFIYVRSCFSKNINIVDIFCY